MLLVLVFLCIACPYESPVPISDPTVEIDKRMIGKWKKDMNGKDFYKIEKEDKLTYKIEENTYNSSDEKFEKHYYHAYISKVNEVDFLNVKGAKNEKSMMSSDNYYLYKLQFIDDNNFRLYPVSDYITEKFSSSADLAAFVAKYMNLSFFYSKSEDCGRVY